MKEKIRLIGSSCLSQSGLIDYFCSKIISVYGRHDSVPVCRIGLEMKLSFASKFQLDLDKVIWYDQPKGGGRDRIEVIYTHIQSCCAFQVTVGRSSQLTLVTPPS